jgi:hypothetical protein
MGMQLNRLGALCTLQGHITIQPPEPCPDKFNHKEKKLESVRRKGTEIFSEGRHPSNLLFLGTGFIIIFFFSVCIVKFGVW